MKKAIIILMLLWGIALIIASTDDCDGNYHIVHDEGYYIVQKEDGCDSWEDMAKYNTHEQAEDYIDMMEDE